MAGIYIPDLDDVNEPEPVEDGFYAVEIINARIQGDPEKGERISVQVSILDAPEDNPRPPFIFHTLFLPQKGQEEWRVSGSKLALKRFYVLFEIDAPDHVMEEDEEADWLASWIGKQAKVKVKKSFNKQMERWENSLSVPQLARRGSPAAAQRTAGGLRTI